MVPPDMHAGDLKQPLNSRLSSPKVQPSMSQVPEDMITSSISFMSHSVLSHNEVAVMSSVNYPSNEWGERPFSPKQKKSTFYGDIMLLRSHLEYIYIYPSAPIQTREKKGKDNISKKVSLRPFGLTFVLFTALPRHLRIAGRDAEIRDPDVL